MRIEVTDNPSPDDEKFVVAQVRGVQPGLRREGLQEPVRIRQR